MLTNLSSLKAKVHMDTLTDMPDRSKGGGGNKVQQLFSRTLNTPFPLSSSDRGNIGQS